MSLGGAACSADLGGSSKYSNGKPHNGAHILKAEAKKGST